MAGQLADKINMIIADKNLNNQDNNNYNQDKNNQGIRNQNKSAKPEGNFNCGEVGRILMVCTGNTCRSPMAAALARKYLPNCDVISAGVSTLDGLGASIGAIDAMEAMGLNIEDHSSKVVTRSLIQEADLILTMTPSHKAALVKAFPEASFKIFGLGEFAGTGQVVADPFGLGTQEYLACAQSLDQLIMAVAEKL